MACSEPFDPGVPLEVGQGCTAAGTFTTYRNGRWEITIAKTVREKRQVAGKGGVVVEQTVLSCSIRSCAGPTDPNADLRLAIYYCGLDAV